MFKLWTVPLLLFYGYPKKLSQNLNLQSWPFFIGEWIDITRTSFMALIQKGWQHSGQNRRQICIYLGRIEWTFWMANEEVCSVISSVLVPTLVHGPGGSVVIFDSSDISLTTQSLAHVIRTLIALQIMVILISQTLARVQTILSQVP